MRRIRRRTIKRSRILIKKGIKKNDNALFSSNNKLIDFDEEKLDKKIRCGR